VGLSKLSIECLDRHIGSIDELRSIIAAWHSSRTGGKVHWRFTTDDARIKLRRLYPSIP
jgi:hypothetical protein